MKPLKTIILISFLLLAFAAGDTKSEYILPGLAYSVYSADIDLDGDKDILVGHNYSFSTQWSGISIMLNYGDGYFELYDSVFLFGGQPDVQLASLNSNPLLEIVAKYEDYENEMEYISIINDFNLNDINYIPLNTYVGVNQINKGDINGDGHTDIVVASTNGNFWGVLYNDGAGNFSEPEYYYSQNWYIELAVSDIDGNGRDDIALCGPETEIYFSFDTGFEYYILSESEHDIEIADMDKDGDMDIITIWGPAFATFICYENLGYQNFNQHLIFSFEGAAGGLRVPDLNNDSLPEITFGYGSKYYVLYNKGGFEFLEPDTILPNFPGSIDRTWADADNNQYQDLIMVCSGNGSVPNLKILFNDGNGNFGDNPVTTIESPSMENQASNLQCYPNPFDKETTFVYSIRKACTVELLVYNITGEIINTLKKEINIPGIYKMQWKGTQRNGKEVNPGSYLIVLKAGKTIQSIRTLKIKY